MKDIVNEHEKWREGWQKGISDYENKVASEKKARRKAVKAFVIGMCVGAGISSFSGGTLISKRALQEPAYWQTVAERSADAAMDMTIALKCKDAKAFFISWAKGAERIGQALGGDENMKKTLGAIAQEKKAPAGLKSVVTKIIGDADKTLEKTSLHNAMKNADMNLQKSYPNMLATQKRLKNDEAKKIDASYNFSR